MKCQGLTQPINPFILSKIYVALKTQETIFVMFVLICNFYKYGIPTTLKDLCYQ
jgi:hypothetical protein